MTFVIAESEMRFKGRLTNIIASIADITAIGKMRLVYMNFCTLSNASCVSGNVIADKGTVVY